MNETNVRELLEEREARYGSFELHARISQDLKTAMYKSPKWDSLKPDQKEALEMVQHKIARILNGDPDYLDNWVDVAGYVTLVMAKLSGQNHD